MFLLFFFFLEFREKKIVLLIITQLIWWRHVECHKNNRASNGKWGLIILQLT